MSERAFFSQEAREATAAAIREVEAQTSAELVVALRVVSGQYRDVDFLFGFFMSIAALLLVLFLPQEFALASIPLDVVLGFVVGVLICANATPLRRLLVLPRRRAAGVRTAAKAAFVDLGISRTSGRSGALIFVSMFERRVELVPDVGLDPDAIGEPWRAATAELQASISPPDLPRFLAAVKALGPVLAKAHPRRADDVNELSDELSA